MMTADELQGAIRNRLAQWREEEPHLADFTLGVPHWVSPDHLRMAVRLVLITGQERVWRVHVHWGGNEGEEPVPESVNWEPSPLGSVDLTAREG